MGKSIVCTQRKQFNTELIQIIIPLATAKRKFQFPDGQNIRDVRLKALQIFDEDMVPQSIINDDAVADLTFLKKVFVTLQAYNGENFVWQKPALNLIDMETAVAVQNYAPPSYTGQRVNWPKSYIEIAAGVVMPLTQVVVLFEVNYVHTVRKEEKQRGARFKKQS